MPVSYQCFAYKKLKKQIGQQCKIYGRLHKKGELGKLPGMYIEDEEQGRNVPSDVTSSFFRGGIVFTMACFEGYVYNLLDEASDAILYNERRKCRGLCEDCKELKYEHVLTTLKSPDNLHLDKQAVGKIEKKASDLFKGKHASLLHDIHKVYTQKFDSISFIDELLSIGRLHRDKVNEDGNPEINEDQSFQYFYQINSEKISKIEFRDPVYLCTMMRLFYGLRCIMSHGSSVRTLKTGALKCFPFCNDCMPNDLEPGCQKPICKLTRIAKLNDYFDECIDEIGKKKVLKTSRLYPRPQPLNRLTNDAHRQEALSLRSTYFPELDEEERDLFENLTELPENYALYHLLRTYTYLRDNERDMYITYRVLVRINQFYLVLAYRMKIAVGRILIHRYDLPDRMWGIPKAKAELKEKITKFEVKHRQRVIDLQNPCTGQANMLPCQPRMLSSENNRNSNVIFGIFVIQVGILVVILIIFFFAVN